MNDQENTKPIESQLRPSKLKEYIGQQKVVSSLRLFIDAVISRGQINEHILLYGPPGIGKTTLAYILAKELKGDLKITSGPAIEKTGDLAAILTNLKDNDVLFIDEIHRLPKTIEEALYPVMEDFCLDIILGKGPAARTVRLTIPRITIIGATTRVALLSAPLRDRFGMILRLDWYSDRDMATILRRSSEILNIKLEETAIMEIVKRSRKTPRIGNRILKRVRDMYEVQKHKIITFSLIQELFEMLQIDNKGLNDLDKKYLDALIKKFDGGPAGLTTLSTALAEDKQTIEEYVEPYLLQIGFIKKTSRGRIATDRTYKHLNISLKQSNPSQQKLI